MEKALILDYFTEDELNKIKLAAKDRCELIIAESDWNEKQRIDALAEAELILGTPEPEELCHCKKLKWMQISWAGVENFLATGLFGDDCELYNMTGAYGEIISEYAIGAAVSLMHCFPAYLNKMKSCTWQREPYHKTFEDSTVLILGAGDIGTQIAQKLGLFHCKSIIGVRRVKRACPKEYDEMIGLDGLDEYLPKADAVFCCLPGTKETAGLFDRERFLKMKSDAIFINTGRGSLVKCNDLAEVMSSGHLWGAAIDLTDPEPLPEGHPLWSIPNLMITPHVSGECFINESPTMCRIRAAMVKSFEDRMAGRESDNKIDCVTGYRKLK